MRNPPDHKDLPHSMHVHIHQKPDQVPATNWLNSKIRIRAGIPVSRFSQLAGYFLYDDSWAISRWDMPSPWIWHANSMDLACQDPWVWHTRSMNLTYGWRNNLVYTAPGGVSWIFAGFWIVYGSFRGREGFHWLRSTFKFQMAWFSARKVEYGSSSNRFSWFSDFSEKSGRLPDTVFVVFSGRGFQIRIFEVFGPNQKEPRRKVTQIRGGITSRSAFFGHVVPI